MSPVQHTPPSTEGIGLVAQSHHLVGGEGRGEGEGGGEEEVGGEGGGEGEGIKEDERERWCTFAHVVLSLLLATYIEDTPLSRALQTGIQ